ncbi:4808_t:CDS:1, partial [Gigaspora rosea]
NSLLFYCRSINDNLPTPNENHTIILHYGDYSASEMEILFYHYMRYMRYMLKNRKKHGKKYKTIKEIKETPTKELTTDNDFVESNKILNSYITYEFRSLRATKTNDANLFNCITFRMNEINMLYDTLENIKLQLEELRVLVEVSVKESEDLVKELPRSEEDLEKDLESLCVDHCQLKEEWTLLNKNLRVENYKIQKELNDLDNFYKFGECIITNEGVHCINSVHA